MEPVSPVTAQFEDRDWTLIEWETQIETRDKPGDPDTLQFSRNDTLQRWKPVKGILSYIPSVAKKASQLVATQLQFSMGNFDGRDIIYTTGDEEKFVLTTERVVQLEQGTAQAGIFQVWQTFHEWQDAPADWLSANIPE